MYCKAEKVIEKKLNKYHMRKDERIESPNILNNSLEDIPQ